MKKIKKEISKINNLINILDNHEDIEIENKNYFNDIYKILKREIQEKDTDTEIIDVDKIIKKINSKKQERIVVVRKIIMPINVQSENKWCLERTDYSTLLTFNFYKIGLEYVKDMCYDGNTEDIKFEERSGQIYNDIDTYIYIKAINNNFDTIKDIQQEKGMFCKFGVLNLQNFKKMIVERLKYEQKKLKNIISAIDSDGHKIHKKRFVFNNQKIKELENILNDFKNIEPITHFWYGKYISLDYGDEINKIKSIIEGLEKKSFEI